MKKLIIIALFEFAFQHIRAQEIYLQTGKNYTKYNYSGNSDSSPSLQSGSGDFYEIGYVMTLNKENLKYVIGLNLNEYNAVGGNTASSYSWNTQYLGIQNTFSFALMRKSRFEVSANGGLGISTLIYGKQNINGQYFDLLNQKEFSGIWIAPNLGLKARCNVDNDIYLFFGYTHSKSLNVSNNTDEKLSFNNSQIQFGINFIFK